MAKQRILATSGTDAITDGSQVAFSIPSALTRGGRSPIVSVAGLAGAETVSFYVRVGDTWEELADAAGDQIIFTATKAADNFNSDGVFGYIKSATVGEIELRINDSR